MEKLTLYIKNLENGNVHIIGYALLGIIIGTLLGAGYGVINVLRVEQTGSGRYATHKTCSDAVAYQDDRGTSYSCTKWETVVIPLGGRIKDQAGHYAFLGGMIGFAPGAILGSHLWNKWHARRKKREKPDDWVERFISDY